MNYLNTTKGVTMFSILVLLVMGIYILSRVLRLSYKDLSGKGIRKIIKFTGKKINSKEEKYNRDTEIGRLNEKNRRVKTYRFLNDLIIDLGLKKKGMTPYEFLLIVAIGSLLVSLFIGIILFRHAIMSVLSYPIVFAGILCSVYTKGNVEHDTRIEAIIEAENIICNSITSGVVVAIRENIDAIPMQVRNEFKDFLDNMEFKNYYIETALLDLCNQLGSISEPFINKCIMLETREEQGIAGLFQDIVEINNIKLVKRTKMKKKFEEEEMKFVISAVMILVFLVGVIAIYPFVRVFYFTNTIGQLLLILDALIIIGEFVYITYRRAKEL